MELKFTNIKTPMLPKNKLTNRILIYSLMFILIITSLSSAKIQNSITEIAYKDTNRDINWNVTLFCTEIYAHNDYSIFGEAPDASDGYDTYDAADPGGPPSPPYLNSYFTTPFPYPNNKLMQEIKHYSLNNTYKVWNFSVFWFPADYVTPTTTTISWEIDEVSDSEYTNVSLCTNDGTFLTNMLISSYYSFYNPAMTPQNFKIICFGNLPPYEPSDPSPANGSTNVSVTADLSWTGGDPDPGDSVTYDVFFGISSPPPKVMANQSGLTFDPGALSYNTVYFWRIVAWDEYGASTAGALWCFKTKINCPPNTPCNPYPANGTTDISVYTSLMWNCSDPDDGDTITYDVYLGNSFPLTKIISNTSANSTTLDELHYCTKYYWKIIAWDNYKNSNESPIWSFTTEIDSIPPTLVITSPTPGYLHINLLDIIVKKIPIFITTFVIGKIEVTVTAIDDQSGINRVEFYVDDELMEVDKTEPYTWTWTERGYFFPYKITVSAFDNEENMIYRETRVWKVL
ncbi:MAG: hypothetical protein BV458_01435 [Thermoplasmata archaeon M9B2D]|nr:MAG: hypothetical protein BV458_01435 [Thermoplasmata archaeon M9B2D]